MATEYRYVKYKQFTEDDCELSSKIAKPFPECSRERKDDDQEHTIHSAAVSVQRSHKNLFDFLRCNEWSYFVTLTFGSVDRVSDEYCRRMFAKWRKEMRRSFSSMYYVAVPEYHKKGSIHYHVVLGGVSADELRLCDSDRVCHNGKAWRKTDFYRRGFKVDLNIGEGAPIFNVGAWSLGWSTATKVYSLQGVRIYVGKYISKNNIDPRFFNKKRFYTSHNIRRPKVITDQLSANPLYDPCPSNGSLCFYIPKYGYKVYDSAEEVVKARLRGEIPMPKHDIPSDT